MTIRELINQLENAANELGDSAEVRTTSSTHCLNLHTITDVEVRHNGRAYIFITE